VAMDTDCAFPKGWAGDSMVREEWNGTARVPAVHAAEQNCGGEEDGDVGERRVVGFCASDADVMK
jgi:hypothetical protein